MNLDEILARHLARVEGRHLAREISRAPALDRDKRKAFYNSRAWRALRYQILVKFGGKCQACGRGAADGVTVVCDHIRPLRHNWELRLEPSNLQLLCSDCNLAKASADTTDWR